LETSNSSFPKVSDSLPRSSAEVDWSATALAGPDALPPCLRLTLDIMLNAPLASVLMWGAEHIMLFNQVYADLSGTSPQRVPGGKIPTLSPVVWNWNRAALDAAWAGASAAYYSQELSFWQEGGFSPRRLDLFYTPVRDGDGAVQGVLISLAPSTAAAADVAAPQRPLRVLVVEDNADARYLVCEMLRAFGHEVDAAADGESAEAQLAAAPYDLLFSDVSLPGMSGIDLARAALATCPGLTVLFASGFGDTLVRGLDFPAHYLQKPYDLEQLQGVLDEISGQISGQLHADGVKSHSR
jgi:CheY-like chemotaxis protein